VTRDAHDGDDQDMRRGARRAPEGRTRVCARHPCVRPAPVCAPGTRVCARHPCVRPAPVCAPGTRVCARHPCVRPRSFACGYPLDISVIMKICEHNVL
jgi:hypothetical protein